MGEGTRVRIDWRPGSLFVHPRIGFTNISIQTTGRCVSRARALGFTYKVEDPSKTDQDIRLGGTQIEYKDQDPEIHEIFRAECAQRGRK